MAKKKQTPKADAYYLRDEEDFDAQPVREERFDRDDLARLMGTGCLRTRPQHLERESFHEYD